jgi:hypothetical protein
VQYQLLRIGLVIGAAFINVEAVAASQVLVRIFATVLFHRQMHRYPVLGFGKVAKATLPSALVTVATCVVPAMVVMWPGLIDRWMIAASVLGFVGGCMGWLAGLVIARHPLLDELKEAPSRLRAYRRRSHA